MRFKRAVGPWAAFLAGVVIGAALLGPVGWGRAQSAIHLVVDGVPLQSKVEPVIVGGTVLAPVRAVAEAVGATVRWEGDTQTVSIQSPGPARWQGNATEVFKSVGASVVGVVSSFALPDGTVGRAWGTGVVLGAGGTILTNRHVIENAEKLVVVFQGKAYQAQVVGADELADLAVLKAPVVGAVPAEFGDSDSLQVGEPVLAVGNPFSLRFQSSVTAGVVSGLHRSVESDYPYGLIQTDAAINGGNSGGPLVNSQGQVIGINTMKVKSVGVEGLGFAIPSNLARRIAQDLVTYGRVSRPWVGVEVQEDDNTRLGLVSDAGLLVNNVVPGSPAEQAGIRSGDHVTAINGLPTLTSVDLREALDRNHPGDSVQVALVRDGRPTRVTVRLAERPQ